MDRVHTMKDVAGLGTAMDRVHTMKDVAGLGTGHNTHFRTLSHGDSRCAPGSATYAAQAEMQLTDISQRAARSQDVQNASPNS
jgi:hypothetical protein